MSDSILIRKLHPSTKSALRRRAEAKHTSMEAEARAILEGALADERPSLVHEWLSGMDELRGEELQLPKPVPPRDLGDLFE